jgi:hypothetical protein
MLYTCTNRICVDSEGKRTTKIEEIAIDPANHVWDEGAVKTPATCLTTGEMLQLKLQGHGLSEDEIQAACDRLQMVKDAVEKDNYRLDRNARRKDNINLFLDYVIDEAKAKEIILSLTAMDFSEILQNEHKGFEHEKLYVFGKDVILLERNGTEEKTVSLYIKFNKLENCFVIIISFHEQKHPLTYYFR